MKNIILKIILIQVIGCVFLIQGIQNLYFYTQNEKYECYLKFFDKQKSECFQKLNLTKEVGEFMSNIYLWFFYGFLIGIFLIGLINWKRNRHILNTIITGILLFSLFPFHFFRNKYVSFSFRQLGNLFSENFGTENLINGIIFTIFGSLILWKTYKTE
ncbi:hypothetical protein [Flavobacterium sp. GP15]|uniref:hypothetical protein n=1 Tax=Flavobacterium sp. GP15 TaxID=2758567 RepID=UPI00165E03D3|nr:hypothetical protein [Flavobacterium sp. GP15]